MATLTAVQTFLKPEVLLRELGIRAGWRVVDFGCGVGYFLLPAARFVGPSGRVVGIDVRSLAVDEATKRVRAAGLQDQVDVFRADLAQAQGSGLPEHFADLILVVNTLFQSDPAAILAEAARVVKPVEGRVAVVEWEEVATPVGPPPAQRVPVDAVLAAAKRAGLTFLSRLQPSPHHYGLLFAKASASTA